jgi:aquaporin Z
MSMNPARTFASAVASGQWAGLWVYFTAPPLGMLAAAEAYVWARGAANAPCAKYRHAAADRCIFCEHQAARLRAAPRPRGQVDAEVGVPPRAERLRLKARR